MRKTKVTDMASLGNKIVSEAGGITQRLIRDTEDFVNDVSKQISNMDWEGMYKSSQKSIRSAIKKGNKTYWRSLKVIRKTDTFKLLTKDVPRYFNRFVRWSAINLRKLRNLTLKNYYQARRVILKKYPRMQVWVGRKYPIVKNFIKENYPKFENFVLNRVPLYKMVYFGNR